MSSTGDSFDERVTARLSQLAGAETLAQACEIVVNELHEWTLGADGWAPAVPEVPVHRVYEIAATLSPTDAERQSLRMEALFISRSASMKANTLAEVARKVREAQSLAGKMRKPRKLVEDHQIQSLVDEWKANNPGRSRGMVQAVAIDLGITERGLSKRLKAMSDLNKYPGT